MKIVFMGTPDFAVPSLQALLDSDHTVLAVYTQPDKPKGRKMTLTPPPVKVLAEAHGIPVYQPTKLRDGAVAAEIRGVAPDAIVVVAYGRLLPKEVLEIPPFGCINVHGSLLPKYRGAGPIQWAVINGEAETGVTTMYMGEGLDTGDMLLKHKTPIGNDETAGELFDRLAPMGAQCLLETLSGLQNGSITPQKQEESQATYAPMLTKEMGRLDFTKDAQALANLVRGTHPWPVAFTKLDGKTLKVHKACVAEGVTGEPGTLLAEDRLVVGCQNGALLLLEVQLEGSRRMQASEFLRGHPLPKGILFGQ